MLRIPWVDCYGAAQQCCSAVCPNMRCGPGGPASQQGGVDSVYLLQVLFLRCAVLVEPLVSCTVAAYYNKPGWAATVITTTTAICQEFILHTVRGTGALLPTAQWAKQGGQVDIGLKLN